MNCEIIVIQFLGDSDTITSVPEWTDENVNCTKIFFSKTDQGFPGGAVVKNPPANERGTRDLGSIPGWGRSLEGGNGNPLQYSFLGNPMDKGAWRATVHVTKSRTRLRD